MPITQTQDDFRTRSIDSVHINPSIMEGMNLYPSILGPGRAVPLERYPPVNLVLPSISGDFKIPSVLTCNRGVWDAAPSPDFLFQWRANGVDIPGQETSTLTTYLALDAYTIDCVVTATNNQGFLTAVSNSIVVELVEPIRVEEIDFFSITGLSQDLQQNMMVSRGLIVTGMWVENQAQVVTDVAYALSGLWVDGRLDAELCVSYAITGLASEKRVEVFENEVYTVWSPTFVAALPIVNPSAETGDMTGWATTIGTVLATNTGPGANTPIDGSYFFRGGSGVVGTDDQMEQIIDITDPTQITHIDNGVLMADLMYFVDSYSGSDDVEVTIAFLDASDAQLDIHGYGPETNAQNRDWKPSYRELEYLPPLTRKIRIRCNFIYDNGNQGNNSYVDGFAVNLYADL